jgi:hypothetical protein
VCSEEPIKQARVNGGIDSSPVESAAVIGPARAPRAAIWTIAVSLTVIATCLVLRLDSRGGSTALAQPVTHSGARGIFAFTGQLSKTSYGVFMVDVDTSTMWCYEVDPDKPMLKFVAARSWKFDRYLEDFNVDPQTAPAVIEDMVEQQRQRRLESMGGGS